VLSLAGITFAINETAWVGVILGFAVLACLVVAAGIRKHGAYYPFALALAGTVLLLYSHLGQYSLRLELIGFSILAAGALLDVRVRGEEPSGNSVQRVSHS
jgi:hypothetical protein